MRISYREAAHRIKQWLIEENDIIDFKKIDDTDQSFDYQITINGSNIHISMHNIHDRITLLSKVFLSNEQTSIFPNLSSLKRKDLCSRLIVNSYHLGVFVNFTDSERNNIEFVNFQKVMYFDGLEKNKFFENINAILMSIGIMQELFNSILMYKDNNIQKER